MVFALIDGHVGLVSTDTGMLHLMQPVALDGNPSIDVSLATQGDRIAAGTIDGRIVVSTLVDT